MNSKKMFVWFANKISKSFSLISKNHFTYQRKKALTKKKEEDFKFLEDLIAGGLIKGIIALIILSSLAYLVWEIKQIFLYIFFATILSLIGMPIVRFFSSYLKTPKTLSAILTILLALIMIGSVGIFIPVLIKQAKNLSLLDSPSLKENILLQYNLVDNWLRNHGIHILKKFDEIELFSTFNYESLPKYLNTFLSMISNFFMNAFSILFLTFFFMKDHKLFNNLLLSLLPRKNRMNYIRIWAQIKNLLSRYFLGIILQVNCMFLLYMIILFSFNIDNAIIIALFCAFLNIIPYIGPLIGAGVFALLSMTSLIQQSGGLPENASKIFWVLLSFLGAQFIDNFFTQPLIYSKSIKSHPVEIFLAIITAGTLFGVTAMILAVPLYTIIRVILLEFFFEKKNSSK